MDLNTCSDLVARLVAKKLVRRERSEADARTYCLYLAPKAQMSSTWAWALPPAIASRWRGGLARRSTNSSWRCCGACSGLTSAMPINATPLPFF